MPNSNQEWKDETGIMTVWKRLDVEYRQMSTGTLPINALTQVMEEPFAELHVQNLGASPNLQYISSSCSGQVWFPAVESYVSSNFNNKANKQWHFLCAARHLNNCADYDPLTNPLPPGTRLTGVVQALTATTLTDTVGGLTVNGYPNRWLVPNTNTQTAPSTTQFLDFPIISNTATTFTVSTLQSSFTPPPPVFTLTSTPVPGAVPGDTWKVGEDRVSGLGGVGSTVGQGRWSIIFLDTIQNHSSADPPKVNYNITLAMTTVHEFVHSFNLHHWCGNMSVNGVDPCIMQWTTTPVVSGATPTWVNLASGATKLCAAHLIGVRKADGK